jgi:hypothetical protein
VPTLAKLNVELISGNRQLEREGKAKKDHRYWPHTTPQGPSATVKEWIQNWGSEEREDESYAVVMSDSRVLRIDRLGFLHQWEMLASFTTRRKMAREIQKSTEMAVQITWW